VITGREARQIHATFGHKASVNQSVAADNGDRISRPAHDE